MVIAATAALLCSCGGTASDGAPILRPSKATVLETNTSDRPVLSSVVTSRGPEVDQVTVRPEAEQPNVVVVMTDDQTVESMRVLPKTRALIGDQGVSFDNSIVTYPTCCPAGPRSSRANTHITTECGSTVVKRAATPTLLTRRPPCRRGLPKSRVPDRSHRQVPQSVRRGLRDTTTPPPGWTRWAALVAASTGHIRLHAERGRQACYLPRRSLPD